MLLYLLSFLSVFCISGCLYALSPFGWCSDWEIYFDDSKTQNKSKTFTMEVCSDKLGYSLNDPLSYFRKDENKDIAHKRLTLLLHSIHTLKECKIDKDSIKQFHAGGHPITADVTCPNTITFNKKFGPTYRSNKDTNTVDLKHPIYMHMLSFPFPEGY